MTQHSDLVAAMALAPQARALFAYLMKTGSVSAREAMIDLDIGGNALTRRILDLKNAGIEIVHERKTHPTSGKRYTRYVLRAFINIPERDAS